MPTTTTTETAPRYKHDKLRSSLPVRVTALRAWRAALAGALALAKTAKARTPLLDALADISERLGPMADPAWMPEAGATRPGPPYYECTAPDGTTTRADTLAGAAEWFRVKPASLGVMLARGRGVAGRKATTSGGAASAMSVRRIGTVLATTASPVPLEICNPKNATGRKVVDNPSSRTTGPTKRL